MSKVICYPRCCKPSAYDDGTLYFEVFSTPEENLANVGYDRYNIDWLIETVNGDQQLKYITFWHEGKEYPNHYFSQWYQGEPFSVNGRSY